MMDTDTIRETYLSFFEGKGHLRRPSASLIPATHDPSVLLTTAGMQPLKPYFLGEERPPSSRLTTCQRCFRTTDVDQVGNTARHLTFFEMLGNFSFGDYFKEEAIAFGWELSVRGFGFDPELIWVTVFEGDPELGLGPDEEAIALWRAQGVPDQRIVRLPRSENFWQAGPTGPCGPCSEMYLDRGPELGSEGDRPGDDTERFLEYWNHVFMAFELHPDGSLSDLPRPNIDTGMGLERMAAIQQDVPSVYETDAFRPLIELAEELSGRRYEEGGAATRAMRILADHSRGMVNLIADGVVPSNEDRGYVLRRIMRRAIQQGRALGLEVPYLERFAGLAVDMLAGAYPHLDSERETILRWVGDEEESFDRTLDRGTEMLQRIVAEARAAGTSWVDAEDAFRLHDTYGFPYDLTKELLAGEGLSVDDSGFEELMDRQRERARTGAEAATEEHHGAVISFVSAAPPTSFVGYERLRAETSVAAARALETDGDAALVKLEESPFYAEGGGQVADRGSILLDGHRVPVEDVYRVGEDQCIRVPGAAEPVGDEGRAPTAELLVPGTRVEARVDHRARHATMRNHTATHLLHAALRSELGTHVRQAGSAVRPDKLRFDFTHGQPLGTDEVAALEERVNDWIKASLAVRALHMGREEAERMGAMALFGEKYGEWVRVVEVAEVSRELCGGTHVANTAEVGIFKIVSEGSSAANVRRIEAVTGPAAIDWFRARAGELAEAGALLGDSRDPLGAARRATGRLEELQERLDAAGREAAGEQAAQLADASEPVGGVRLICERVDGADQAALLDLADEIRERLGTEDAAILLGGVADGKVALVASFTDGAVGRGLSAADAVRDAAGVLGGGGGGRPNVAQAGGRDPERLDDALAAGRQSVERSLSAQGG